MKRIYTYLGAVGFFLSSLSVNGQTFLIDEDFSGTTGTTPPAGWTNNEVLASGGLWVFDNPGGQTLSAPITDPAAIFDSDDIGNDGNPENTALESPQFDASAIAGDLILSFDHYFYTSFTTSAFYVEVYDGTQWVEVLSGNTDSPSNPTSESIDITTDVNGASNAQVRFRYEGDWSYYWIVDNIKVEDVTCPAPSNIVSSNITENTADIDWTENGSATEWNIEWGTPGFTPGVGDEIDSELANTSQTSNITGLTGNTVYDVYVQADCGADQSVWVGPISFITDPSPQTPVSSFPWDEDFETGGADWTLINGFETNQWQVGTATNNGGSNGLYISEDGGTSHTYDNGSTSIVHAYRDITLPAAGEEVNMSFDWIADAENCCDYLRVFIVPTSFTPSAGSTITASGSAPTGNIQIGGDFNDQLSYTNFETTIPNDYLGETFRVVFQWRNDFSSGDNPPAGIDNVNIDVVTCAMPSDIAFSDIGSDSLVVSWTSNGSETDWVIEYGETGFTLGSGTQVATTDNPDTITGLDSFTEYDFYVWSDCGSGDLSDTLGPETVTTLCTASSGTEEYTGCEGDGYSVEVNGTTYDEATPTGTETIIGGSFTGCDSIVSINLTYAPPATGVDVVTACESFTWIDGNEYTESNNSATHVLAGASANGCDSIVTLNLTITPSLDLTVEEVVNSSNDLVLIAQETNASYQWLDCNDGLAPIAGANNQTLMPIANGSYAVRVSKGACTDTTNCVDVLTLSTEEITLENKLNIYPNPSNGIFNVEGYGDHATSIIVLDALGRKVLDKVISESTTIVDLTNMKQGVYLFNIVENGEQTLRKVILK